MNLRVPRPLPERLSKVPKYNTKQTPQRDETHIRHNRRNISTLNNPRRNEFTESIPPHILVDGDSHENGSRDWFIRVDGIG